MTSTVPPEVQAFIARWQASGASERANCQPFLSELCGLLGLPRPDPKRNDPAADAYVFERGVTFENGDGTTSAGRIDLYRRGSFVLEAKQGSDRDAKRDDLGAAKPRAKRGTAVRGTEGWDRAMMAARGQAERYARALPVSEGWPPFLAVVDVGHTIELYSDFTRSGKTYVPFPDARSFRIFMPDLEREEVRERLRALWTDPLSLDPSRKSAKVTREVAERLARLAKSLEASGHAPERVAHFLMRCIFTMFAEDVRLIPAGSFTGLLEEIRRDDPSIFPEMASALWRDMDEGRFSTILRTKLLRFNGGLFAETEALALTAAQLELLVDAARSEWRDVEPAIFGTLLERALDPVERHKLGAHYTPRAYVERLVLPTVVEPLREDWEAAKAAAVTLASAGKREAAIDEIKEFHRKLCETRVLDPACGTGNFLYVTLEHMKRLEGEVLDTLAAFGERQAMLEMDQFTVDPHQLLGIEINPRAAAIADLVLWIGYLQWHFRTRGEAMPAEPVLKKFNNIECRDAILAYDSVEPLLDESGEPVTRWDGRTYKKHPVTGEDVPDETARIPIFRYENPSKANWPAADFVVGNPPFVGDKMMRAALGDGYVKTLRGTYPELSGSSDYVLYWWDRAAHLLRKGRLRRFGFIATNSLRQTFNQRVLKSHLISSAPVSLVFVVPDHPWVDSTDGADVRIAMTVAEAGDRDGVLEKVVNEFSSELDVYDVATETRKGKIRANLAIGADIVGAGSLQANAAICCVGVKLFGTGFIVTREEAAGLGLGTIEELDTVIVPLRNGRDLTQTSRDSLVIDLFGRSEHEVRASFPSLYQHLLARVKPDREAKVGRTNDADEYARNWWVFGKPRPEMRKALRGLGRFIVSPETAKHRFFVFLDSYIRPEGSLVTFALDDAYFLGVLSSRIHVAWALAAGARLGVGNDPRYNKTRCFDPFPFPAATEDLQHRIRELAESLDAHRKARQAEHPDLTVTEMYNALEKLRAGEALSAKEKAVHEKALVSVLKQIHDDIDAAVFEAYGWPSTLTDEEILERLVALNAERAEEERRGLVRWLRPEFQNPEGATQTALATGAAAAPAEPAARERAAWPKSLAEQAKAVRAALSAASGAATPERVAKSFKGARVDRVAELLETLETLGQVRAVGDGRFAA